MTFDRAFCAQCWTDLLFYNSAFISVPLINLEVTMPIELFSIQTVVKVKLINILDGGICFMAKGSLEANCYFFSFVV